MVTNSMTSTDPNPVFKVTAFLKSNISKMMRLTDKVTIARYNRKPYITNRMVPYLVTLTDL